MKVIFLDRDGVLNIPFIINGKCYAPKKKSDFRFYPYTKKNCLTLIKLGYSLIVITNQPDVSKGTLKFNELKKMHKKLEEELKIKKIYTSYSSNNKNINRKPNPGLLIKAIKKFNINIKKSYMIGDRKIDTDAAKHIGCRSIFIDRNYYETKPKTQLYTCRSFNKAVKFIKKNR
jgi:D-glycero-D-manno-heptose 1,7-bisphosphate phosphatase